MASISTSKGYAILILIAIANKIPTIPTINSHEDKLNSNLSKEDLLALRLRIIICQPFRKAMKKAMTCDDIWVQSGPMIIVFLVESSILKIFWQATNSYKNLQFILQENLLSWISKSPLHLYRTWKQKNIHIKNLVHNNHLKKTFMNLLNLSDYFPSKL